MVEVSLNIGSSFVEDSVVDEHAIPEAAVRDVASGHFVLIRVNNVIFVGVDSVFEVVPYALRLLLLLLLLLLIVFDVLRFLLIQRDIQFLLFIRFDVEVAEEEIEHHGVHANPPDKGLRIIALDEE